MPFAQLFPQDPVTAARGLIGARLLCGGCSGIVVETEAYAAVGDEAAHTFFKPSAREFVANHDAGAAYVYLNYGMYWPANVLTRSASGEEGFVLLRARTGAWLGDDHGGSFLGDSPRCWFEQSGAKPAVIDDTRIGINRATDLRWRFLAEGSDFVSKKPSVRPR